MASPPTYETAFALVADLHRALGGQIEDRLDETTWRGNIKISNLNATNLTQFIRQGHQAEVELRREGWTALLSGKNAETFDFQIVGRWEDAFDDPAQAEEAEQAADQRDLSRFLKATASFSCTATLRIHNDVAATGAHWVRTEEAFLALLDDPTWLPTCYRLTQSGAVEVVVEEADDNFVATPALHIRGRAAAQARLVDNPLPLTEYRETYLPADHQHLPTPISLTVRGSRGLERTASRLNLAASKLGWMWLADSITDSGSTIEVRFEGVRSIQIRLRDAVVGSLPALTDLWRWATTSVDAARREALQQAITLAVRDERDLATSPPAVLRTARYLHRMSQQRLVVEALSARRGAREAASAAARAAAETSRGIARKTFDRVAVQVAAALGIVIANRQALLDEDTARLLSGGILLLLMVMLLTSLAFEYPAARSELEAAHLDLDSYRETLPDEDIDYIRRSPSAVDAAREIERSRNWTAATVTGAMVVVAIVSSTLQAAP